ncbi:aminoglycoside N(3)-acetyltransferase [Paenibacillus sp. GCM10023252]|uniref:aminoglycoside N(3)-acetyltransferase n=1 Tax=Paenibacillus sp. GCM10023252 TaxID=3252649 RepID=UPI003621649E
MAEPLQGELITTATLAIDLKRLGIEEGASLLVHSSLKSLGGWAPGGATTVVLALQAAIGDEGTLVMPAHSSDLTDPEGWQNPPVKEEWWEPIRETMPPFDPDFTPTRMMGAIVECFRTQREAVRSMHPHVSFAAWGKHKKWVTDRHSLAWSLGEASPLARWYELDGWVLLIGVGHANNTSLHLSEYRASYATKKTITNRGPLTIEGVRQWVSYDDIALDSEDFESIGAAFEQQTGLVRRGLIAGAEAMLMPQRALVDFGVKWMEQNRE